MDMYEERNFDEFVEEDVKDNIRKDLKTEWEKKSNTDVVFISAIKKQNIDELRNIMYAKVKEAYLIRYPYKAGYY